MGQVIRSSVTLAHPGIGHRVLDSAHLRWADGNGGPATGTTRRGSQTSPDESSDRRDSFHPQSHGTDGNRCRGRLLLSRLLHPTQREKHR